MTSDKQQLAELRRHMTAINETIMAQLNRFFTVSNQIGQVKNRMGLPHFDPVRESQMLHEVLEKSTGPMPHDMIKRIFKEIFKASVEEMGADRRRKLQVNRLPGGKDLSIDVRGVTVGGSSPVLIGGPCAVEHYEQIYRTAEGLRKLGIRLLRGGAFKPRTSPYSFQGLEADALKMMRQVADAFQMAVVTEVLDVNTLPLVEQYADIVQVGTRNMFNYSLLRAVGGIAKPVLLKRGFMATIDEFILAAEYIHMGGNRQIILCERGIRTFETQTRNTLDISSIPILKKETPLPVIVDVSHALGRKDVVRPIARAALAAGADGLMFEAHYHPAVALSDAQQQLDLDEAKSLVDDLKRFL